MKIMILHKGKTRFNLGDLDTILPALQAPSWLSEASVWKRLLSWMLRKWKYEMNVLWCGPKKEASETSFHFDETVVRQPT